MGHAILLIYPILADIRQKRTYNIDIYNLINYALIINLMH